MTMGEAMGQTLREARREAGLSLTALAGRLGIKRQQVFAWENGERSPQMETLMKLAEALNTTPAKLLEGAMTRMAGPLPGAEEEA